MYFAQKPNTAQFVVKKKIVLGKIIFRYEGNQTTETMAPILDEY